MLPGANVTLTGRTGAKTSVTDGSGEFRFAGLEPDTYVMEVELSGFQRIRQEQIVLEVSKQLVINPTLKISTVTEDVLVVGEPPVVDVRSSATGNTLSQGLLNSVPISRQNAAQQLLNYSPGVNSGSAFGGAGGANALLVDGVDTRDPSTGGAYTFYNYNLIQEVQVGGLGAPAELGGFTGAVVNTVTKSGGNRFSGLFDIQGAGSGMNGKNVPSDVVRANPALTDPDKIKKLVDYTVQFSGPIAQNRAFFFVSMQRFFQDTDPTGPRTLLHELSPRFNTKLTFQLGANDNLTVTAQQDDYNQTGRAPGGAISNFQATDALTNAIDSPEYLYLAQWRHLFGQKTFTEVKYTGWNGYYDFFPPNLNAAMRFDQVTGEYSGSQGWILYGNRSRQQVNASLSHYADAFGKHSLKFGAEIERSKGRDQFSYTTGAFFTDLDGQPYLMYTYGYDISAANHRSSVFAQDSWEINSRLTVNPGIRGDFIRGVASKSGQQVFSTNSVAPRLGVAWDVLGDTRSVVKAFYGHFYESAIYNMYQRAISGIDDFVIYDVTGPKPFEVFRDPAPQYRVDPDIKQPRVDEFDVSFERALGSELRLSVTGMWRKWKNEIAGVLPSARWAPTTINNPLTNQSVGVYRMDNPDVAASDRLITNPKGFVYRDVAGNPIGTANTNHDYRGVIVVLNKRFSQRYQAQASYVLSHTFGWMDNSGARGLTRQFESATTALINANGDLTNDRRHEFKLLGSYQVPVAEVALSAYYRIVNGQTYTPFVQASSSIFPLSAGRNVLLEPRGSRRNPTENVVDLRLEKIFSLRGNDRLSGYLDLTNLFNAGTITTTQNRAPSVAVGGVGNIPFGAAGGIIAPRQLRVGARWTF